MGSLVPLWGRWFLFVRAWSCGLVCLWLVGWCFVVVVRWWVVLVVGVLFVCVPFVFVLVLAVGPWPGAGFPSLHIQTSESGSSLVQYACFTIAGR